MLTFGLAALLTFANPVAPVTATEVTARGSDSTITLVKTLAEAYAKTSGQAIKIEGGGSGKGAEACAKGEVDFCFLSRDLKDSEKTAGLVATHYALDGVAVVVNKANPVADATVEQVRGWFDGTVTKWADDKAIVAFTRNADSGTREVFQEKVMGAAKFSDKVTVKHDAVIVSSVSKIPSSVAFTSLAEVTADVKAIKIAGVAPSHETVRNKTYPLSRTLNFATKGEAKPEVKAFIEWATGKDGQAIVEKSGYTAIGGEPAPAPAAAPAAK